MSFKNINDIERSQDWPKSFEGSPAFRLSKTKYFHDEIISQNYFNKGKTYDAKNSLGYQISKIEAFDIDNEVDLTLAVCYLIFRNNQLILEKTLVLMVFQKRLY